MDFETFQLHVDSLQFGKDLPEAVYLHKSSLVEAQEALAKLVFGIAAALKISDEDWDLIKLFKRDFKMSFLSYPDFLNYPYPSLRRSHIVDLAKKTNRSASYEDTENPPILHRRELFVHPDSPRREEFKSFTEEGVAIGLYQNTRVIGTLQGWNRAINRSGYMLDQEGHLVPLALNKSNTNKSTLSENIHRHKTAISRDKLSVPMFTLAKAGYLDGRYSILDYGCGKGDDLRELEAHDINCIGWDPVYSPDVELEKCDLVNLGYVINVIEEIDERRETLSRAFDFADKLLAVSAMLGNENLVEKFRPYKDGIITKTKTFQKYYYQSELKEFIETCLATEAIAAGPGLFLIFKDKVEEQRYLSERQRTRLNWKQISSRPKKKASPKVTRSKIENNKALLNDFWYCCLDLGRPAANDEFDHSDQLRHIFGSHSNALDICREYYSDSDMARSESVRKDDLLVYLALDHFGKRQVYSRMPESLQRDIKYHFGKYQIARDQARDLLFSVSNTELIQSACEEANASLPASDLTGEHDLVFQKSYINLCPPLLRVYIGCALQLYGDLEGINLIKAHIQSGKVTLMVYDGFDDTSIPLLKERIKIKLKEQEIDFFDYVFEYRPQPLLMKSKLIGPDHPVYDAQKKFDGSLMEALGPAILETHLSAERLDYLLHENGIKINGFKITRKKRD